MGLEEYTLLNVCAPKNKLGDVHDTVIKEIDKVKKGYIIIAGDLIWLWIR